MKDRLRYNLELISDKNSNPLTRTEFIKHGDDNTGEWLDEKINKMSTDLSGAAQKSYVDAELAKKAKQSDLESTEAKAESASESVAGLETKTDSLQAQIDALVIEGGGDSNPEVVQARVDAAGVTHTTLKKRIDSEVNELKSDLSQLVSIEDVSFTGKVTGKYIHKNGNLVAFGACDYLPAIQLRKGDTIVFNAVVKSNDISAISKYTASSNTFENVVTGSSTATSKTDYVYTALEDTMVALCYYNSDTPSAYIIRRTSKEDIYNRIDSIQPKITPSWVDNTGILPSTGNSFSFPNISSTDFVSVKGCSNIYISSYVKNFNTVGIAFYDESLAYITGQSLGSDYTIITISVPENACYVKYCCLTSYKEMSYYYLDKSPINESFTNNFVKYTDGYISRYDGNFVSFGNNYFHSDFIPMFKGDSVITRCLANDTVAYIAEYKEDGTLIRTHFDANSGSRGAERNDKIDITEDFELIKVSGRDSAGVAASFHINRSDIERYEYTPSCNFIDGKYITIGSLFIDNAVYKYSELIPVKKGDVVRVHGVMDGAVVAYASFWKNENSCEKVLIHGHDNNKVIRSQYAYIEKDGYIRFCTRTDGNNAVNLYITTRKYPMDNGVDIDDDFDYSIAFTKTLCVGDSLTHGCYYRNDYRGVPIKEGWPYMFKRLINGDVTNLGHGGATASSWYKNDMPLISDYTVYDSAVIWLGTNYGLTDTLDTDVTPYSNYNDYADTHTGNYCKIIEKLKEANPEICIVLCTIFVTGGGPSTGVVNAVIRKIAEKYNLAVVDMSDLYYLSHFSPENVDAIHPFDNQVHFGKAGNIFLANRIHTEINKYFKEDISRCEFLTPHSKETENIIP